MRNSTVRGNEMKKIVVGSVTAIAACALLFGGINQTVKATEVGKTKTVPTSYSIPYAKAVNDVPSDYVKKDYKVKLIGKDQPTKNDLKMEEAAELASQNLWWIYQLDLSGKTIEMTYNPVSTTLPRAEWVAEVKIKDDLLYQFTLDAITGEKNVTARWVYHNADIPEGMDIKLVKHNEEYQKLAREVIEKYQLLEGKIKSIEYAGQGFMTNLVGHKNSDISLKVRSDEGDSVQLTFSRYNKELIIVAYDNWVKETEAYEQRIEQEMKDKADSRAKDSSVYDQDGIPTLLVE
jgi:hypothetical protein